MPTRFPVLALLPAFLASILPATSQTKAEAIVPVWTPAGIRSAPIRNWKSLRDRSVEKQARDFSCGASSIATILKYYYGQNISENDVLKAIGQERTRANFSLMQEAVGRLGFRAVGLAANFDQLSQLKMPVIVYVRYRRDDHFSVVRGIGPDTVLLADSSLGNRTFSRSQFLRMWETRSGSAGEEGFKGRMLAILPVSQSHRRSSSFFVQNPERQTVGTAVTLARMRGIF